MTSVTDFLPYPNKLTLAVALCLLGLPEIVCAFEENRPQVLNAYIGDATQEKLEAALEGVEELLDFATPIVNNGNFTAGAIDIINFTISSPSIPQINVLTTINAGFDSDLAPLGDPVILDNSLLFITRGFSTPRDIVIGGNGAIIDTGIDGLAIDGDLTANGTLLIQGDGSLVLYGNATWNSAPFLAGGLLSGTTANLDTAINGIQESVDSFDAPRLRFNQSFDGTYDETINGAMHFIKSGHGEVSFTSSDNNLYGGSVTIDRGTVKLVGEGKLSYGDLTVNGTGLFSIHDATGELPSYKKIVSISNLSGDGRVTIGQNGLDIYQTRDTVFEGSILGSLGDLGLGLIGENNTTLTFTESQLVVGPTYVRDATLKYVDDGNWRSSSWFMIGGTLDFSGANLAYGRRFSIGELQGFSSADFESRIILGPNDLNLGGKPHGISFFSGIISGSGGVNIHSNGTVILTGDNTYTGETWIGSGRLLTRTQSLSDRVKNDSELELFQPGDAGDRIGTYSGEIYGPGRLISSGKGVVWLRGNNSYTGGTTVADGVLLGSVDSLPGPIDTYGFVGFYQIEDGVFQHDISGDGGVLVFGPGELEFRGQNDFSGGTFFSGTIIASENANLGADESPLGFVGGMLRITKDMNLSHPVLVSDSGGTVDTSDSHLQLSGGLSGNGVIEKIGQGRLTVTGDHPEFSGLMKITEGKASLIGSNAGSVHIFPNTEILISANTQFGSQLVLNGATSTATIDGGVVSVTAVQGDYAARTVYPLITATAGVSGAFNQVTIDNPNLDAFLSYDLNRVMLTLLRLDFSFEKFALTPTQQSVSVILDQMRTNNNAEIADSIAAFDSVTQDNLSLALESASGTSITGITPAVGQAQRSVDTVIMQRLGIGTVAPTSISNNHRIRGGGSTITGMSALSLSMLPTNLQSKDLHGAWLRGFGGTGSVEVSKIGSDASLATGGLIGGYDVLLPSLGTLGVLFGMTRTGLDQSRPHSETDIDSWQIGSYGRLQRGPWVVSGILTYADNSFATQRTLGIGPNAVTATAKFDGTVSNGRLNIGYRWGDTIQLEPYASIQVLHQDIDRYTERSAGAIGLVVDENNDTSVRSSVGLSVNVPIISEPNRNIRSHAYLAWTHEYINKSTVSAGFIGDPSNTNFSVRGISAARNTASFGAGIQFLGTENLNINFGFDGEANGTQHFITANAGIRYSW